ncbi:hypothetical protein ACW9HQ_36120 [Nocardia gipuzkoensis]
MSMMIVGGAMPATAAAPTPMGMNKSGAGQPVSASPNPVRLNQWTIRPGYPETAISAADELLPNGSGAVVAQCGVQISGIWSSLGALVVDVMKNDIVVATGQFPNMATSLELPATSVLVAPGDRLWVRMSLRATFGTITVSAGAKTYLYYDLA